MTKEITKAIILQQLENKFGLRELAPEIFRFSEEVVPIYDVGQHLRVHRSTWANTTITTTGGVMALTVPSDEKWFLRAYSLVFVTGAYTVAGVYIFRNARKDANDFSYLDLTAGQSASYLRTLPETVVLEPRDALHIHIDGYTSTGTLRIYIDYMREEIR